MKYLFVWIVLTAACWTGPARAAEYGIARRPTPVLNTAAFGTVFGGPHGTTLKTDRYGQVRELEFIALPGTVFRLLDTSVHGAAAIYRVTTDDYPTPAGTALYVDSRFIDLRTTEPPPRVPVLPPQVAIIASLRQAIGSPYVWGSNVAAGVPELSTLYFRGMRPGFAKQSALAGLDCSGLLYWATNGWTPRNTSQLVRFGRGVPVAGKTVAEVEKQLAPLDLIVWNGHVIIVLDRVTAIESRLACGTAGNGGVVTTPLRERLTEVMGTRQGVDAWPAGGNGRGLFVVRRWWGE